jgi:hypothetical protein
MPIVVLVLAIVLCVSVSIPAAVAQGAATGGTKDVGSPTMVIPIRPRDEQVAPTAVPNRAHRYQPAGSSWRYYRYRTYRR